NGAALRGAHDTPTTNQSRRARPQGRRWLGDQVMRRSQPRSAGIGSGGQPDPATAPARDRPRRTRWLGAAVGLTVALVDTLSMRALGVTFAMNGHDVGMLVAATFGSSLAILGFLLGHVVEGRRRDRVQAAIIH